MKTDEHGRSYLNINSSKRELFDALKEQVERAEAAEARAAQLVNDLYKSDEVILGLSHQITELFNQLEKSEAERDELARQLEQAQQRIKELDATLNDTATAPYENQPNDGNEWEKEYYLRGMHR